MINSTHNLHIDGVAIKESDLMRTISLSTNDRFTRWVFRPLAILAVGAVVVAGVISGAVLLVLSLALLPVFALGGWALKSKLERDIQAARAASAPVQDTAPDASDSGAAPLTQ